MFVHAAVLHRVTLKVGKSAGRTAPPSRYAVESDSEDDVDPEDYGRHAEASRTASSRKRPEPSITVDLPKQSDLSEVIVAIEDAGRSWAEGLDNQTLQEAGSVTVDNKKVCSPHHRICRH